MKKKLFAGLATGLFLAVMASGASASIIEFDFDGSDKMISLSGATTDKLTVTGHDISNTHSLTVDITAWSYDLTTSAWVEALVYGSSSSDGLGVVSGPGDSHKLDGGGSAGDPDEGLLFTFANEVALIDIDFNYFGSGDDYNLDVDGVNVLTDSRVTHSADITSLGLRGKEFFIWADGDSDKFYVGNVDVVPEPATMLLLGTGLVGLAGSRLRRKKNA